MNDVLRVAPEVASALADGEPVVALETTLVSHGFPRGAGADVARACEERVRGAGALPATIGVAGGAVVVGIDDDTLASFAHASDVRKVGPRDVAACAAQGALGATTVGGTLAVCGALGIRFLGTGGLGGVHHGFAETLDVSADLGELARTPTLVVASGVKSLVDVSATSEALEALGVPVLGWRTGELPLFYRSDGGPPVSARVEDVDEVASLARLHWDLGRGGILLARPPDESLDVEPLVEEGIREAARRGVRGQEVTPFVLTWLHDASGGRTIEANKRLVVDNAGLAAELAVAFARNG